MLAYFINHNNSKYYVVQIFKYTITIPRNPKGSIYLTQYIEPKLIPALNGFIGI